MSSVGNGWKPSWIAGVCVALALLSPACKDKKEPTPTDDDPGALAEDGSDSASTETNAELLTSTLVAANAPDGRLGLASADVGSDLATRAVGDGAKALFFPRGCLDATNDAAAQTVTYTFHACTGPNGLFRITGEVKARYRIDGPTSLHLDMTGSGISVNKATIDWHATADISGDGAGHRTMVWKGQLSGSTWRGRTFSRTNEKTVKWAFGDRCYAVEGVSTGTVRDRQIRTEVTGFRRCGSGCPEAGGKVTITDVTKNKQVQIAFDGTNLGLYTGPKGDGLKVQLLCSE